MGPNLAIRTLISILGWGLDTLPRACTELMWSLGKAHVPQSADFCRFRQYVGQVVHFWSGLKPSKNDGPDSISPKRWVKYENRQTCILVTKYGTKPCHLNTNIDSGSRPWYAAPGLHRTSVKPRKGTCTSKCRFRQYVSKPVHLRSIFGPLEKRRTWLDAPETVGGIRESTNVHSSIQIWDQTLPFGH